MENRPIYLVTGLLDAGKTSVIKRSLEDPNFSEGERTLILCFEEGDEEYDEEFLTATNSEVEYLDFDDFSSELLAKLDDIHQPDRIFIEFNGMRDDNQLLNMELPNGLEFAQMIAAVDASKFKVQVANLAQFMFNHISRTEIVVINRFKDADFRYLRTNLKSMNRNAVLGLEDEYGQMYDLPREELFDVNDLNISDTDYGLFYMDVVDNLDRYRNKKLEFNAFLFEDSGHMKVFGRLAMVCCANDVQRLGVKVIGLDEKMENGQYYHVKGTLKAEKRGNGYSLYIQGESATPAVPPEEEYVSFS